MTETHEKAAERFPDLANPSGDARDFAVAAARIANDRRIEEIVVLDLRGLTGVADFFVLGTGTSERQMDAVLDEMTRYARAIERRPLRRPDTSNTIWLVADFVDVVVHLFDPEHRAYYDLDGLWGDAPQVDWNGSSK